MKLGNPAVRPAAGLTAALAFTALIAWPIASAAQAIIVDGTTPTVVDPPVGNAYTITGGATRGTNLFHSFQKFNVDSPGGSATFQGDMSTTNVLTRVTGVGEMFRSTIDGLIDTRSSMPLANFFLINPNGVIFGPSTELAVGGAFRVSTADSIILADGKVFSATPMPGEVLTSAPPQAFGFLSNSPAPIEVNGAFLVVDPPVDPAGPGQTLSLIGGDVTLSGGAALVAPGGLVQVVSVASPGSVDLNAADLGLGSFSRLGRVNISEGSGIVVGGTLFELAVPSGSIVIRGGELALETAAILLSDTADLAGAGVGIDVDVRGSIAVRDGSLIQTLSTGSADASAIVIKGGALTVTGVDTFTGTESSIESQSQASGRSGTIDIQVATADVLNGGKIRTKSETSGGDVTVISTGTLTVAGQGSEISTGTFLTSDPLVFGGDLLVAASDVVVRDGGTIASGSIVEQAGERLSITASNSVSLLNLGGISSLSFQQGAGAIDITTPHLVMDAGYINISTLGTGDAGQVAINANTVSLVNGAQIASSSQGVAIGAGGGITINAPGSVTISGMGPADGVGSITLTGNPSSGLFSTTEGTGNAGQITVLTPTLTVTGGGTISVATEGTGSAGNIVADVGTFTITGGGRIDSSTTAGGAGGAITVDASTLSIGGVNSGLFSTASSTGSAGEIAVSAATSTVADGGRISVATASAGSAGNIVAEVGTFTITGGGRIDSSTTAGGAGGAITVDASTLSIGGADSGLFSTASAAGSAGSVVANVGNAIVTGGGRIDSSTTGAGDGGAISMTAASQVEISNGGSVRADSSAGGLTGNITIGAGDRIVMSEGSISTRAATSDGGNITLTAPNIIRLTNSQITTSVEGDDGAGGNIFIDPQFVILQGSTISANAFGGPGGSVTIVANNFLTDAFSFVTASSALSTPGTVQIESPENNVAGDIAQLPRELVDASRLLRGGCTARRTGAPSSFTVAGRGGVPADPDGYLPSYSASGAPFAGARGAAPAQGFALAMAGWDCWR